MNHANQRILAFLLAVVPAAAQDPPTPPGGFAIGQTVNVLVTWSDGYRTRMNLYHPTATAPSTGWPGIAAMHGANHGRGSVASLARALAAAGYATFAFDARDNGDTRALNPGWTTPNTPERVLLDSAESFTIAAAQLGPLLDMDRLGMTGRSMGGMASQEAAAWSGRVLPLPGLVTTFPRLRAIATQISPLDRLENTVPNGTMLRGDLATALAADPADPIWLDALAGRYGLVRAALAPTVFNALPLLRTNDVPVLAAVGWDDYRVTPRGTLDGIQTLAAGVPFKVLVNGNGHGSPSNAVDTQLTDDTRRRWFDRFLKSRPNDVLREPPFEVALTPYDFATYTDPASHWAHRTTAVWPPPTPIAVLHLRGSNALAPTPPSTAEPGVLVQHRPAAGYDLAGFVADLAGNDPSRVFASVPLVSHDFAGPPLPTEVELLGRPHVDLAIDASVGNFQIAAALLVRDPGGQERYLVGGVTAVRGGSPGLHRLRFPLRDVATLVPAGSRFVVRVENVSYFRSPLTEVLEYAPSFTPADLQVRIGPGTACSIELPITYARVLALTPRLAADDPVDGLDHPLQVEGGADRAGAPYAVLMSGSGFGPGLQLLGTHIPINFDAWTSFGAAVGGAPGFAGFVGVLDGGGAATARMVVPAALATAVEGMRLTFAVVAIDGTDLVAGGPAQLDVVP